jgi:hypothetical protein
MNKITKSIFLLLAGLAFSCGGDEDEGYDYNVLDRDAAGEIDHEAWVYGDGYAEVIDFGDGEELSIDLVLEQLQDGCDISILEGNSVFFYAPNEEGLYKLKLDLNNPEGNRTVTLWKEDGSVNYIATEGAVEILSITPTQVTGRLDVKVDNDTFVNGNFTISLCSF